MNNNEYNEKISSYINAINNCIEDTKKITIDVMGKNMFMADISYLGFLDRSIQLARGFISMLKNRNLTCAGALLRLLVDNCLRLHGINIAADVNAVTTAILKGESLGKLKDKNGNRMTDAYLKEQLVKYDQEIVNVYNAASGFIHFSDKAIFQSITGCSDDGTIRFQVGAELPEQFNDKLIECSIAYIHYYLFFLKIMNSIASMKTNYDKNH